VLVWFSNDQISETIIIYTPIYLPCAFPCNVMLWQKKVVFLLKQQ
jgi:hypothetical protein